MSARHLLNRLLHGKTTDDTFAEVVEDLTEDTTFAQVAWPDEDDCYCSDYHEDNANEYLSIWTDEGPACFYCSRIL